VFDDLTNLTGLMIGC